MKIKHTLYVLLLVFSLFPLLAFGTFMICENDRNVENIMKENLETISGTQILNIKDFCESRKEKMEMLAQLSIVRFIVNLDLDDREGSEKDYLTDMLTEQKGINDFVESISIIDRNFYVVTSTETYESGILSDLRYTNRKYLSGEFFISNVYHRETEEGDLKVVAAYQGILDDGELIGYVVEEINVEFFDKNRTQTNLWEKGTLYLLDGNDVMITAGTAEESRKEFVTTAKEREDFVKALAAADPENNPQGEFSYRIGGVDYITYYSDIEYTDWNIKVTINLSSYQDSKKAYRLLLLGGGTLIALFIFVTSYFISRRMTRAVDRIAGTLKKVEDEKNYTLRVENYREDEIGVLALKINDLLDYMEKADCQEKERQEYLAKKAETDSLTGLKNKRAIEIYIQQMVKTANETGGRIALGFVDIDDFREYNTLYGHLEGDRVIQFVASVLNMHSGGVVGRNGGDEFLFALDEVYSRKEIDTRIERIFKVLNDGLYTREGDREISVSCSIGLVIAQGGSLDYSDLIQTADEAMYRAKHNGKKNCHIIDLQEIEQSVTEEKE